MREGEPHYGKWVITWEGCQRPQAIQGGGLLIDTSKSVPEMSIFKFVFWEGHFDVKGE